MHEISLCRHPFGCIRTSSKIIVICVLSSIVTCFCTLCNYNVSGIRYSLYCLSQCIYRDTKRWLLFRPSWRTVPDNCPDSRLCPAPHAWQHRLRVSPPVYLHVLIIIHPAPEKQFSVNSNLERLTRTSFRKARRRHVLLSGNVLV